MKMTASTRYNEPLEDYGTYSKTQIDKAKQKIEKIISQISSSSLKTEDKRELLKTIALQILDRI